MWFGNAAGGKTPPWAVGSACQAPPGRWELDGQLVRLGEDVARLGEAGRLASRMQRPVTLDEAVSHRLRP